MFLDRQRIVFDIAVLTRERAARDSPEDVEFRGAVRGPAEIQCDHEHFHDHLRDIPTSTQGQGVWWGERIRLLTYGSDFTCARRMEVKAAL